MFEACRAVDGRIPLRQFHRARLSSTAVRLGIPFDIASVDAEASQLATDHADAVLKVPISAGAGGRGYRADAIAVRRIVAVFPAPAEAVDRASGVTVRLCRMRLALQPMLAGLKHLNRLEQVLARRESAATEIAEGLMCDVDGRLVEGTATNLFLVREGCIVTPDLRRCGVAGVMREVLLEQLPGIELPIEIRDVALKELDDAEECFLTNAVIGVWLVARILDRDARQRPGRIAQNIIGALETRIGFPRSQ
jgi:4-amino-4-deoxychorismate lyase